MRRYWLMKSEPGAYSIDDLARDGKTAWEGVRNYQARNFMRDAMRACSYQVYLDGVPLRRPLDLYRPESDRYEHHLMDFWPDPGQYTLRLVCVGRNDASLGFDLPLVSVRLRQRRPRVAEIGLHKHDDWRFEQFLYQRAGRNK